MQSHDNREFLTKQRIVRALAYLLIPGYLFLSVLLVFAFNSLSDPKAYFYPVNSDLFFRTIPDQSYHDFAKIFVSISNEFTHHNIDEKISLLPNFYCDDVPNSYYKEHQAPVNQIKTRQVSQWVSDIRTKIERNNGFADLTVSFNRHSSYENSKPTQFFVKSKVSIVALKDNMGLPRLCVKRAVKLN